MLRVIALFACVLGLVCAAGVRAGGAAAPAAGAEVEPAGPRLRNGSMTHGKAAADGWEHKWEGEGKLTVSRDDQTFKKGPASLRVETVGGRARGQVSQIVDAKAGDVAGFAGYVKTSGQLTATVGVMVYTKDWQAVQFMAIQQTKTDQDWLPFAGKVSLPETTARCAFAVMVEGEGTAWLDECASDGEAYRVIAEEAKRAIPASSKPKPAGPPKAANAWSPGEGFFPDYPDAWKSFHEGYKVQARKGEAELVFLGDSITQAWGGEGKKIWAEYYAKRKAVNFGIGGDGTPQILWRLEDGALDGLKPRLVVLMIGTNNRWRGDATPESVSRGIEACVKRIREKAPTAKLLVLGVFPAGEKKDDASRRLFAQTNALVEKLADDKDVFFLDLTGKFLEADGGISKRTMPDFLHLSEDAYRTWAQAMEPTVVKLLGEK
jgi:beta-glucosidase